MRRQQRPSGSGLERAFLRKGFIKRRRTQGSSSFSPSSSGRSGFCDRGIYGRMDQENLNGFANEVPEGSETERLVRHFPGHSGNWGFYLSQHFPFTADIRMNSPDEVMTEK